jgi:hypothetical protein
VVEIKRMNEAMSQLRQENLLLKVTRRDSIRLFSGPRTVCYGFRDSDLKVFFL